MPATLDLLEVRRSETYAALLSEGGTSSAFDAKVGWLEGQMQSLYRFAIEQSKADISVREVFELWDKMVSICDFFIEYARVMASSSSQPVCYDDLLDLRLACDEKREFHRCAQ